MQIYDFKQVRAKTFCWYFLLEKTSFSKRVGEDDKERRLNRI